MISGAHIILYSTDAEADRTFFREALGLSSVDSGDGWLIFGLPPAELAVHPADTSSHELFLMCDDVEEFIAAMTGRGVPCSPVRVAEWGRATRLTLPGGGPLSVYQPTHASPLTAG